MAIPVAGPFVSAALLLDRSQDCGGTALGCGFLGAVTAFAATSLVVDGLAQVAGATLLIVGLASKREVVVLDATSLRLSPLSLPHGAGIGLSGRF